MIIKKKKQSGTWHKFEGAVEFQIRPFKFSKYSLEGVDRGAYGITAFEQFMFCVVNWKGLQDEDEKTVFKYNEENKEYLYDYYDNVRAFVFKKIKEEEDAMQKSIKN